LTKKTPYMGGIRGEGVPRSIGWGVVTPTYRGVLVIHKILTPPLFISLFVLFKYSVRDVVNNLMNPVYGLIT
jgi:hypothetical protein